MYIVPVVWLDISSTKLLTTVTDNGHFVVCSSHSSPCWRRCLARHGIARQGRAKAMAKLGGPLCMTQNWSINKLRSLGRFVSVYSSPHLDDVCIATLLRWDVRPAACLLATRSNCWSFRISVCCGIMPPCHPGPFSVSRLSVVPDLLQDRIPKQTFYPAKTIDQGPHHSNILQYTCTFLTTVHCWWLTSGTLLFRSFLFTFVRWKLAIGTFCERQWIYGIGKVAAQVDRCVGVVYQWI